MVVVVVATAGPAAAADRTAVSLRLLDLVVPTDPELVVGASGVGPADRVRRHFDFCRRDQTYTAWSLRYG